MAAPHRSRNVGCRPAKHRGDDPTAALAHGRRVEALIALAGAPDDAHAAGCTNDMTIRVLKDALDNAGFWERAPVLDQDERREDRTIGAI